MSRHNRYKQRSGGDYIDHSNPLPGWIDAITMDEIVTPAISPYGHVLSSATWKVWYLCCTWYQQVSECSMSIFKVLQSPDLNPCLLLQAILSDSTTCPFTKQPLTWGNCRVLTKSNLDSFTGRIIADDQSLDHFGLR